MKFLKKFYNTEAAVETGGGVNIAQLMATQGYNSENKPAEQTQVEATVEDKGNNEQTEKTETDTQTATVGAEAKVENVVQEAEKPKEEVAAVVEQPKVETAAQVIPSWQEVLKQQQPDNVLKELGLDDSKIGLINKLKDLDPKMVQFLNVWESKGDVAAYLKEWTTDYDAMSATEVMRSKIRDDYPKASEAQINALYKQKVIETYKLDSEKYLEEEVAEGQFLLDAEADKYRDVLKDRQKTKLLPAPLEAKTEAAVVDTTEADNLAKAEEYKAKISNDPYTKDIFTNKRLSIGEGTEAFNFPVEPAEISDILFDTEKWVSSINKVSLDEKGHKVYTPDIKKQMIIGAVARYGEDFLNKYAEHFIALGGKKVANSIENASELKTNMPAESLIPPNSPAAAMASGGRITN